MKLIIVESPGKIKKINSILKENYETINEAILKDYTSLFEFLAEARENEKALTKYIPKEAQDQVRKLTEKKKKFVEVKKILKIKCLQKYIMV